MLKKVTLYTHELKQLRRFYMNVLNFPINEVTKTSFNVQVGTSTIKFIEQEEEARYHFAINIPGNQFTIIKEWISDRYPLETYEGIDEIYRVKFVADSFYIKDPSGNLVEFIARRSRDFLGTFTLDAFYNLSEISIVTPSVSEVGELLQDQAIPLYFNSQINTADVNYLGVDDSFIVLTPEGRKWAFSNEPSIISPLVIHLTDERIIEVDSQGQVTIK
ncbi:MAG TPA: hypothetical protein VK094_08470 [Pseudogracilibacillus sp.]|nr:hypothetical protein [Pseudogracilibacillus sp.]